MGTFRILGRLLGLSFFLFLSLHLIQFYYVPGGALVGSSTGETSLFVYLHRRMRRQDINTSQVQLGIKELSGDDTQDTSTQDINSCSKKRTLVGFAPVRISNVPSFEDIAASHPDLNEGGHFIPNCSHSEKVSIIIPFRDRQEHLRIFLYHIHPVLKRQLVNYNIFVIEQAGSDPFNRAMLFNVGYSESIKRDNFTCFVFHDVDLIPENDRNIYSCDASPRHMSVAVDKMKYRLPYRTLFGGIGAFRKDHFLLVNGFSNKFWGWGAEDDDMANRIAYHGLYISRLPPSIARYKMIKHKHQKVNFNRYKILHKGKKNFSTDGLSSLNYTVQTVSLKRLYTLIRVKLAKA